MATVLLGWELGAGFGHVVPLRTVARGLAARGHRPVFALRNVVEPWPVLAQDPYPILQSPVWHDRPWHGAKPFRAGSYADILAIRGWNKVDDLAPQVDSWQGLLDVVKPDLLVGDHSPTLCLAAFGTLPVVTIGSWFCVPPADGAAFPLLLGGQEPLATYDQLLDVVTQVQKKRNRPAPRTLPEVLTSTRCFPTVLPEIDPYRSLRKEPSWDPLEPLPSPGPLGPGAGYFAYLSAECAQVEPLLTQLAKVGCRGTTYLRGAGPEIKARLRKLGLTVLDEPAAWSSILAQAAVLIHHGGAGTTQSALAAGRPQVLLPQYLEQSLTAKMLLDQGVAAALSNTTTAEAGAMAVQQLLTDRRFADKALVVARNIHARLRRPSLPAIVEHCVTCLSKGSPHAPREGKSSRGA